MAQRKVNSVEDGNLNATTLQGSRKVLFRDIDLSFSAKPNGELYVKKDAAAVKQAISNIVQTNHFEKPFKPLYGGNLRALLFELADDEMNDRIKSQIVSAIRRYEPRAELLNIESNFVEDAYNLEVQITFKVINSDEIISFSAFVSRLR